MSSVWYSTRWEDVAYGSVSVLAKYLLKVTAGDFDARGRVYGTVCNDWGGKHVLVV